MNNYENLNFDAITTGECIDLCKQGGYVFINDGHITTVVKGE